MITPTIHLNGTPRDRLLEQVTDAADAVRVAIEKLTAATPNARDHYPQGPHAIHRAMAEHHARQAKLADVLEELMGLSAAIDAAEGRR